MGCVRFIKWGSGWRGEKGGGGLRQEFLGVSLGVVGLLPNGKNAIKA